MKKTKIGYHGTSRECAQKIIRDNFIDSGSIGWLGTGVYFFEESYLTKGPEEALSWATNVRKKDDPVVLMAEIEMEDQNCIIDLIENVDHRLLYQSCQKRATKRIVQKVGTRSFNDSVVFELIDKTQRPKIIRALVDGSRENRQNSYIVGRPQIMICVKDVKVIKDIRIHEKR
jgi:hypothetical protein